MSELFPIESVTADSPRIAWMKKHGAVTMSFNEAQRFGDWDTWIAGFAPGVTGNSAIAQWFCDETGKNGDTSIGMGETEADALADLAEKWCVPLWNEEGQA